jgi:hypothetical protein
MILEQKCPSDALLDRAADATVAYFHPLLDGLAILVDGERLLDVES